jgi:hypothetical protein
MGQRRKTAPGSARSVTPGLRDTVAAMSSMRWWLLVAVLGCAGVLTARPSWAGGDVEVLFTVKPPAKGEAPQIEATVVGAPNLPAERFVLLDKSAKPPIQIKAASRRAFNQGPDTVAVAIVMSGWEMWIGNDTYLPKEDPTRTTGALTSLKAAFDKLALKTAMPTGSVGMVITYADKAQIRVPMGPIAKLTGAALGTQKDYKNTAGLEMVKGVELALAELHKVTNPRKVLIVLGDGTDTNPDTAKAQLALLKKQAQTDRVQVFSIVYKASESSPMNFMAQLSTAVSTVSTTENIGVSLKSIVERLADRQYLTFPGYDKAAKTGLAWDGKAHDLAIRIDNKDETEPQPVVLAPAQPAGAR